MASNVSIPVGRVIDRQRNKYGRNNLVFPLDAPPQGMLFVFKDYSFSAIRGAGLQRNPVVRSVGDTIYLPLPRTLDDKTSINIQQAQLGITGELVARGIGTVGNASGLGDILTAVQNSIKSQLPITPAQANDIVASVMSGDLGALQNQLGGDISKQASFLLRKGIDSLGYGRSIDAGLGSAVNPKAALAFDGVALKGHSFDWNLSPRYRRESDIIKKIFQVFKKNSLPEYIPVTLEGSGSEGAFAKALLKYPSMVDIFLVGLDQSYYFYYKTAMISSVDISFSGNGNVIMEGGKPGSTNLIIQLIETDIHTSEDYAETGDFGGGR